VTRSPGDRRFEDVALPHVEAAYELARWLTGGGDDAEDVVQEAYLRLVRRARSARRRQ
jgi:DNA-directed RNA polymerase specialized sigma24 family protein